MYAKFQKTGLGLICSLFAFNTQATMISDLDLNNLSFEVIYDSDQSKAHGTSNQIGYQFDAVSNFYHGFSNTSGWQTFNDLPGSYDDIHAGSNFTIHFDSPIQSLLLALANDNNTGDGPDIGLSATDAIDISFSGTQSSITDIKGGLIYFQFNSLISSITHINNAIGDGWDLAFFANPKNISVSVPAAFWLFSSALLAIFRLNKFST